MYVSTSQNGSLKSGHANYTWHASSQFPRAAPPGPLRNAISKPPQRRDYACTLCDSAFTTDKSLKAHHYVHIGNDIFELGEKLNSCRFCAQKFARRHDMLRHQRNVHKEEISTVCATCTARFSSPELLNEHCTGLKHVPTTAVSPKRAAAPNASNKFETKLGIPRRRSQHSSKQSLTSVISNDVIQHVGEPMEWDSSYIQPIYRFNHSISAPQISYQQPMISPGGDLSQSTATPVNEKQSFLDSLLNGL